MPLNQLANAIVLTSSEPTSSTIPLDAKSGEPTHAVLTPPTTPSTPPKPPNSVDTPMVTFAFDNYNF